MRPSGDGRTFLCFGYRVWEYLVAGRNEGCVLFLQTLQK